MEDNLKLLKTELHDDGSYTEYWGKSYYEGYTKTYSSNNKLIFWEDTVSDDDGLKTVNLNKYCYRDDLDNVFFPSTIYNPSVPECKYEVHTLDSLNRCILIEHYDTPNTDKLIGKTVINYNEDGCRTEFYIDYYSCYGGASSTRTVYDLHDRKITEVEYFDPDAQNKAQVTTFEYPDDNSTIETTILNYNQKRIEIDGIRAIHTIINYLTRYFKEINYADYEMTQIIDIRETQKKDDGSTESIYIDNSNNISYRQIDSPDDSFSRMERFSDTEFKQLYSIEFYQNGKSIDVDSELFANTKNNTGANAYFESITKVISQLIGEEHREYVLEKIKKFYNITYQALKANDITQITKEKQEFGAQYIAEWTLKVAQICIDSKIPQEYLDTILQNTAMTTFEVLEQHLINNNEIDIDVITNSTIECVMQACKQMFKDLKDRYRITEECYYIAIENLKNYRI